MEEGFRLRPLQEEIAEGTDAPGLWSMSIARTGRSTALAHRYIRQMVRNPGQWVDVRDHYPTNNAHLYLLDTVMDLLTKAGLRGKVQVQKHDRRIRWVE